MIKRIVLVLGVVCLGLGVWWYHYTGTPAYSLYRLQQAVKAKDYETARFYVDDERLADDVSTAATDAMQTSFSRTMEADKNPFSGLGVAMMQMMLPRLKDQMKDTVKTAIRQALSGNDTLTDKGGKAKVDFKQLSTIHLSQSVVSGNTAEVVFTGLPQPNDFDLKEIHLRRARIPQTRNWRIVGAPDVNGIFQRLLTP
jgi:hypothetical protein